MKTPQGGGAALPAPVSEQEPQPSGPGKRGLEGRRFGVRLATAADRAEIEALMQRSIRQLQEPFLKPAQIDASFDIMGLDDQLIEDRTYYVVEDEGLIAGCGGWSRRATLYGGSHSPGRDEALLDPAVDAARIRAMYTHPDHVRRGVGRLILEVCEDAARRQGFRRAELVATLAGLPLYRACGYHVVKEALVETRSGVGIPGCQMTKAL
ncbi:GNAT family N-acetyltransferase [Pelagibius sp.]|uniref:GNAT family N-acetyltransferase n=1 Tax=Pelagibius sp. TaxID=1931238 RepID=UPI003B50F10A